MQLVGDVERRQNRNFSGIHRQRAGGDLAHASIDVFGQCPEVFGVAVRAHRVGLIVNLNLDGWRTVGAFLKANRICTHPRIASAISGSAAATASSIAWTRVRIASRSASKRSI